VVVGDNIVWAQAFKAMIYGDPGSYMKP
jgi:hypothetical protein